MDPEGAAYLHVFRALGFQASWLYGLGPWGGGPLVVTGSVSLSRLRVLPTDARSSNM